MKILAQHTHNDNIQLYAVQGDLTHEQVDIIVNAANAQLAHGGGLAATIAQAGGPKIQSESRQWVRDNGPVRHETPALTGPGDLPCGGVVHAVGPRWGEGDEDEKLAATVRGSLEVANNQRAHSISIPAISTGIFGFPVERGARIILESCLAYRENTPATSLDTIRFTNIDEPTANVFAKEFERRWPGSLSRP